MLIAHLPSGYLVGAALRRLWPAAPGVMAAALIGSVLPDVDVAYFLVIDGGRRHHHDYLTHWPLFWLASGAVALPLIRAFRRKWFPAAAAFFVGVMVHMALDTVASPIKWLAPFSDAATELVRVPGNYSHWLISFVLHWTFLLELAVCGLAWFVWRMRAQRPGDPASAST